MIHIYFFLVGSIFASFLGVVVDRFPEQSICYPASHCDSCHKRLEARDLVPIFSQLINRFSCRFCGQTIPKWYAGFEFLSGLLFLAASYQLLSISEVSLILMSLTLSIYDSRHQEYPLLVWLFFQIPLFVTNSPNLCTGLFLAVALVSFFVPIGIGSGDFLFLASATAIFSLTEILLVLQIACLLGIASFIIQKKKGRLAFVPYLSIGVFVLLFIRHVWLLG
ncbi:prepilin peptidase [Streptococcus himalayensis]|uniref:prepilin peptidase n=1 Tax=Streptococcus himalayensis TaxID=1888195 RepID=UPI00083E5C73|nr:A24 family peptidase [Streptococcus himalayensis]